LHFGVTHTYFRLRCKPVVLDKLDKKSRTSNVSKKPLPEDQTVGKTGKRTVTMTENKNSLEHRALAMTKNQNAMVRLPKRSSSPKKIQKSSMNSSPRCMMNGILKGPLR
jgi:hypothetical protein